MQMLLLVVRARLAVSSLNAKLSKDRLESSFDFLIKHFQESKISQNAPLNHKNSRIQPFSTHVFQ